MLVYMRVTTQGDGVAIEYSESVVLHIAHGSTCIPLGMIDQYVLSSDELNEELVRMTDA